MCKGGKVPTPQINDGIEGFLPCGAFSVHHNLCKRVRDSFENIVPNVFGL